MDGVRAIPWPCDQELDLPGLGSVGRQDDDPGGLCWRRDPLLGRVDSPEDPVGGVRLLASDGDVFALGSESYHGARTR